MAVIENPISKKCENHCPNCGANVTEINWGGWETGDVVYQEGECTKCGCYFKEYYTYSDTEFEIGVVPRVKCKYPLSRFYIYKDEVPAGERVSSPEDCEKCDNLPMCTDNNHCMIHIDDEGNEIKQHRTKL